MHVSDICCKAARHINVLIKLHSVLEAHEANMAIHGNFLLSNFKHCPVVRHFCVIKSSPKMLKIQEMTLRFVYKDFVSTYKELLAKGTISRLIFIVTEVYKA